MQNISPGPGNYQLPSEFGYYKNKKWIKYFLVSIIHFLNRNKNQCYFWYFLLY